MKNNKGFSLVELIIVIAIMAVLIGVLAPQYLKYVEKSRVSSDKTVISDVKGAMLTSLSDEDVYSSVGTVVTVSVNNGKGFSSTGSALEKAIGVVVGNDAIKLTSKTYKDATVTFTATFNTATSAWTIAESWTGVAN